MRADRDDDPAFRIPVSLGPYPVSVFLALAGMAALLGLNVLALAGVR